MTKHLIVVLLTAAWWLVAVPGQSCAQEDVYLQGVEQELRAALAPVIDQVEFEYSPHSTTLLVKHRTREFMIHGRSMTGEVSERASEQQGPSYRGFLLRVHLQDAGTTNQAMVPQTIVEPYWQTALNVYPLANTDKQVFTALSYGNRVDHALIEDIEQALTKLEGPASASAESPEADEPAAATAAEDTLEGVLRIHPKFHYRYYIDGFGDGQQCALFSDENKLLEPIAPGSLVRVEGRLGSRRFGVSGDQNSALVPTWIVYMQVDRISVLRAPATPSGPKKMTSAGAPGTR